MTTVRRVIAEFIHAGSLRRGQDRALARYVRDHVAPFSPFHGATLRRAPVKSRDDLAALPIARLDEITDGVDLVLRPTVETLADSGDRELRMRWWWARLRRRSGGFNRGFLEPRYKPIHWHRELVGGRAGAALDIGYTEEDLETLAEVGRAALEMAEVRADDVIVSVYPPGPVLPFWQLHLGARRAGVPMLSLPADATVEEVARLRPTVLAGRAGDLMRLLETGRAAGYSFGSVSTLLIVGEPLDPALREQLAASAGSARAPAAVVAMWAPPGVRALWSECRDGVDVHTWPAHEIVELVDPLSDSAVPRGADGEVVWTPLGWKGSVVLRLRTGVFGCIDDSACVSCGRTTPRLRAVVALPPFARILDGHPGVAKWQAELRTHHGAEELIVFLTPAEAGHPGRLLRELDRQLSVTQFVVLDGEGIDARLRSAADARVLDLRS